MLFDEEVDAGVPLLRRLRRRMCDSALMDERHAEPLQIARYQPDESYSLHLDFDGAGAAPRLATLIVFLNDDFEGGETVLYPGTHASETPEDGSPQVAIRPAAGSALCFGQSFKFGREGVAHSSDALLHEGAPLASPTGGSASAKYVLRTDVCYTLPRR